MQVKDCYSDETDRLWRVLCYESRGQHNHSLEEGHAWMLTEDGKYVICVPYDTDMPCNIRYDGDDLHDLHEKYEGVNYFPECDSIQ